MTGPAQLSAPTSAFPIIQTLVRQIQRASESHLTGSLNFDTVHVPRMRLYFVVGRLVWAGGGLHRLRRWRRLLNQHCPGTGPKLQALAATRNSPHSEYEVLRRLVQSNHISREVARTIIQANVVEVLFDIVQTSKLIEKFSCTKANFVELKDPITLVPLEELISTLDRQWRDWCDARLAPYSPNLAPALIQPQSLKSQVAPQTYDRLIQMLQGELSLRELAVLIKWELSHFSQSMIAYEQQGIIQLRITPDLVLPSAMTPSPVRESGPASGPLTSGHPQPESQLQSGERRSPSFPKSATTPATTPATTSATTPAIKSPQKPATQSATSPQPLIMCVDDSPIICNKMKDILEGAGYRYLGISDPIKALPLMLESKPDLMLIDLVMPVISGYELCNQIRRIAQFEQLPLITFSSSMLDRIRAKLAGINDSLDKSVPPEQILATVERWLTVRRPST